jgi:uncharacterized membrane protein HdeD (DUF308 family)
MAILDRRGWRSIAWRGGASALFGVAAVGSPGFGLAAITVLFGVYAFVDGVLALSVAIGSRSDRGERWLFSLDGFFGLAVAFVTLFWSTISATGLLLLIGLRALVLGGLQIAAAWRLRHSTPRTYLYGAGGAVSVLLGLVAFATPDIAPMVLLRLQAGTALLFGAALLVLAFWLRGEDEPEQGRTDRWIPTVR